MTATEQRVLDQEMRCAAKRFHQSDAYGKCEIIAGHYSRMAKTASALHRIVNDAHYDGRSEVRDAIVKKLFYQIVSNYRHDFGHEPDWNYP